MSEVMDSILDGWDRRMAVRRGMLAHLGVDIADEAALLETADIRATLCACAHCQRPEVCAGWVAQNRAGLPAFCGARAAFENLAEASRQAQATVA